MQVLNSIFFAIDQNCFSAIYGFIHLFDPLFLYTLRYVMAGENEKSYNFVVPFEGCGSKPSCSICDSIDNILIIQQDEEVQGEFDAARKISCSRTGIEEEKKIFFKPFIVEMLDVVTVPTAHGGVDCWMDIQRGIFPQLTSTYFNYILLFSLFFLNHLLGKKSPTSDFF